MKRVLKEARSKARPSPPASSTVKQLADAVTRAVRGRERVILTRRGKALAAVVPVADLELIEQAEGRQDAEAFRAAHAEWERDGRKTISLDRVARRLGIKI